MIKQIRSIIPANGWFSVFIYENEPWFSLSPLACFAAVRKDELVGKPPRTWKDVGFDEIVPIGTEDNYLDDLTDVSNLFAIIHESEITQEMKDYWTEEAKKKAGKT